MCAKIPLKITKDRKSIIQSKDIFVETVITINNVNGLGYVIFCYETIKVKYGINSDDFNLILYLNKLAIFSMEIIIIDNKISLKDLFRREYIVSDYSLNNKSLYKLSEKALVIINTFNNLIKNTDKYIKYNREVDIDLENKMKSVLSSYGDKLK